MLDLVIVTGVKEPAKISFTLSSNVHHVHARSVESERRGAHQESEKKKECKWINKQINNKHHLSKNILTVKTNGMLGRFLTACQKCGRNQCELWPVVPAA